MSLLLTVYPWLLFVPDFLPAGPNRADDTALDKRHKQDFGVFCTNHGRGIHAWRLCDAFKYSVDHHRRLRDYLPSLFLTRRFCLQLVRQCKRYVRQTTLAETRR